MRRYRIRLLPWVVTHQQSAPRGWLAIDDGCDDGGFSGGNINRPSLKRLLADVENGRIDVVVVYKIDRLSRSLADFARIIDLFDQHGVTFVGRNPRHCA